MADKKRTTIYFDEKILKKAKNLAKNSGMSVSAFLTMLINSYRE